MVVYLKSHSGVTFRSDKNVLSLKGDGLLNNVPDDLWEDIYSYNKSNIDFLKSNNAIVISKKEDNKLSDEVSNEALKEVVEKQSKEQEKTGVKKVK